MEILSGSVFIVSILGTIHYLSLKLGWHRFLSGNDCILYSIVIFFCLFFLPFSVLGLSELVSTSSLFKITINRLCLFSVIFNGILVFVLFRYKNQSSMPVYRICFVSLNIFEKTVIYFTLSVFVFLGVLLLLGFPRGFEVWAYHLPIAINFFQKGSFQVWDTTFMHAYPANMSVWIGFWLRVVPERIVSVFNLPFLAACSFVLYLLSRQCGGDRSSSILIACGISCIPLFSFSALELGADIAGVTFMISAVYFFLKRPAALPGWAVMCGLSAGLAYGFKSLHLVPVVLIFIAIVVGKYKNKYREAGVFLISFLTMSGIWFFRNYLEFNNPVYPVHLGKMFDLLGFKAAPDFVLSERDVNQFEWVRSSWEWLIYPWVEWHQFSQNFKHSSGLGAFFAGTIPMAWIGYGIYLGAGGWRSEIADKSRFFVYFLGTALFIVWWFLGDRQPRYVMGGIALLLPLAAFFMTTANKRIRKVYENTLVLCLFVMLLVPLFRVGVSQAGLVTTTGLASRTKALEYPEIIDKLSVGTTILDLADRPSHYPLFGSHFSNQVVSYSEATRLFRSNDGWKLDVGLIRQLGVTHVYAYGDPKFSLNCLSLEVEGRLDRNPFNGKEYKDHRVLYRVLDNCL